MQGLDTRALVSIITGLAAFMFMLSPWQGVSMILGVVALAAGVSVLRAGRRGMGVSTAGVTLGTIAVCSWIIVRLGG